LITPPWQTTTDHAAVADDDGALTGVLLHDPLERGHDGVPERLDVHLGQHSPLHEGAPALVVGALELLEGDVLGGVPVELHDVGLRPRLDSPRLGQGQRRLPCASQRARVEHVDRLRLEPAHEPLRLRAPGLGERRVGGRTVVAAQSHRQCVANQDQLHGWIW
jgi:hypothetical protein